MRLATTRRKVASKQRRVPVAAEHLRNAGKRLRLYHLQGPLAFAALEPVVRELMARALDTDCFILNLRIEPLLATRRYHRGQTIVAAGQGADELFVITRGSAMVSIPTQNGVARLNSFTSGMTFGDIAFIDRSPRSANVTALGPVECRVLTRDAFGRLDQEAPAIKIRLLHNLAHGMTSMLRHLSRELAALK